LTGFFKAAYNVCYSAKEENSAKLIPMEDIITVCIVEDIKEIRQGVKHILDESALFVCSGAFRDAEEAMTPLPALQPNIVLMDIGLPGMTGIECIKKVKSQCPGTQFMMFTIYEDSKQVFDALAAGANGYLLKKTPQNEILEALKELHEGGAPMSTHIARKVVANFQQSGGGSDALDCLSPREQQVLQLLAKGYFYKEIGYKLNISTGTVRQHIHHIYKKLHVQNSTEAVNKFYGR
jgi:DNA-binding NarL/FixJ family response regulator